MTKPKELDIATLRSLVSYDPETGQFTWQSRSCPRWNARWAGKIAGSKSDRGYWIIMLMHRRFRAHRIAFAITHGRWPAHDIDHIDGNQINNRISNLREATRSENMQNQARRSDNASGYTGVTWNKAKKRWKAQIMVNRKPHHIGYFKCQQTAWTAYRKTKTKLHSFQPTPRS